MYTEGSVDGRHAGDTPLVIRRGVCSNIRVQCQEYLFQNAITTRDTNCTECRASHPLIFLHHMTPEQQRLYTMLTSIGIQRVTFISDSINATQAETQAAQAAARRG
jgi:hypothetical protein